MSAEAWRRIGSDLAPLDLVWKAWYFRYLHRCPRKLGDELALDLRGRGGTFSTSGSICVAGVVLSVPSQMSAEAWRRIGSDLAPLDLVWQA